VPFTNALNALNAEVLAHPDVAKRLIELGYALGAFLALDGSIKLFTVALGPMTRGLGALVGLGGLAGLGASLSGVAAGLGAILALGEGMKAFNDYFDIHGGRKNPGPGPHPLVNPFGSPSPETVGAPNGKHGPGAFGKQSFNSPIYVHVTNQLAAADIGRSITGGMADATSRPSSGPSFQDYRMDAPVPGFAVG
jgi:hypothetical protein